MSSTKKQKSHAPTGSASKSKKARHERTDFTMGGGDDEDLDSDDADGDGDEPDVSSDESLDARETAEEKRRRLAKEYLASMQADDSPSESEGSDSDNNSDEDTRGGGHNSAISNRLRKERLDAKGRYFRDLSGSVAHNREAVEEAPRTVFGGFDLAVTSVALASDESFVLAGSKDNSVVRFDLATETKQVLRPKWRRDTHPDVQASEGEILAVASSSDGRYAVSGGRDMKLRIYDARLANAEVKVLTGHRGAITSLAFRRESYSLFTGSLDRCLKHWDLSEMGYLETLFGHQDTVTAVDCWTKERPISVSTDRTARMWKVVDESHSVFRGHKSSADSVQLLTDDTFITGGQDGALHLWKDSQKKPQAMVHAAHGFDNNGANPNWICGLASIKMSNVAASGSSDGYVRLWNANAESRQLDQVAEVAMEGFVNALAMSPRLLVAGTGREHSWGRWWCVKGNKNKVVVARLPDLETTEDGNGSSGEGEEKSCTEDSGSYGSEGSEEEEGSEGSEEEASEEEEESD